MPNTKQISIAYILLIIVAPMYTSAELSHVVELVQADTSAPAYTPFQPSIPRGAGWVLQSNNIANTQASYDITFRTGLTQTLKTIELSFPAGTNLINALLLEASGVGPGTLSKSGQTLTYTISTPVSVTASTVIRLEFGNVYNPISPGNMPGIKVVTKDTTGTQVDAVIVSNGYLIRQIGSNDLADNSVTTNQFSSKLADGAVTTNKIASDAVTADKISGISKLIFATCSIDFPPIPAQKTLAGACAVPGASEASGDRVIVTDNGPDFNVYVTGARVVGVDNVNIVLRNDGSTTTDVPALTFSILVFHQ